MRHFAALFAAATMFPAAHGDVLHAINSPASAVPKGVGDVNGDGSSDIVVSATGGHVKVYSGATGDVIFEFHVNATGTYGPIDAADFNGDGVLDLVVGSPTTPGTNTGSVAVIDLVTKSTIITYIGTQPQTYLGRSVCVVRDLNGDGVPEIFAGALKSASLISGKDGLLIKYFSPHYEPNSASYGYSVGSGDADGDGLDDLIVGDPVLSTSSVPGTGLAVIYHSPSFQLPFVLNGQNNGDRFGEMVSIVPDLSGDIYGEILVHARNQSHAGNSGGSLHVFKGPFAGAPYWSTSLYSISGGKTYALTPDKNHDGTDDFLVAGQLNVRVVSGKTGEVLYSEPVPLSGAGVDDAGDVNFDGETEGVYVTGSGAFIYTHTCGQITNYGVGCAGSGGLVPSLTASGCPVGLGTINVSIANAIGPTLAVVLVGTSQASVPLNTSCSLLVGNALLSPIVLSLPGSSLPGTGSASIDNVKCPPNCHGLLINVQAFFFDQQAPGNFSATSGLMITFT